MARKAEATCTTSDAEGRKWASPWVFQCKYPKSKPDHSNSTSDGNKMDILHTTA